MQRPQVASWVLSKKLTQSMPKECVCYCSKTERTVYTNSLHNDIETVNHCKGNVSRSKYFPDTQVTSLIVGFRDINDNQ